MKKPKSVYIRDQGGTYDIPENLDDFFKYFQDLRELVPEKYRENCHVEFALDRYGLDGPRAFYSFWYDIPWTQEEIDKQNEENKKNKKKKEEQEKIDDLTEFARLKGKLGM